MLCFPNSREAPCGSDCFSPYVGEVVWGRRVGPHHPLGLIEMQTTHNLFYLQAFPSPRNICKLTWPEVQLQGEGYLT